MEEFSLSVPQEQVTCGHCVAPNAAGQKFCTSCSFPIGGTEEEKQNFRTTVSNHKRLLREAQEKIRKARNIIYALAALMFISGIVQYMINKDFATMIVNFGLTLLYLVLAAWADKNPFGAILTAFVLYITLIVINVFFDSASLAQGIIFKIIFIGAFIRGVRSAQEARTLMAELEKVKATTSGLYFY